MRVVLTTTAPLMHGAFGESAGNATLIRRMALVALPGMPRVPCVSGNALRGCMRRIVMRDLLERAGLSRETLPGPTWDRLYAALANGGHLDGAETRMDPAQIRELREALPPLSVFGAALYSWLLPGHMSVGILWPRCRETMQAGLVSDPGKRGCDLGAEDLVEEVSLCRHVDREHQDPEVSGVTPMPTTMETLSAGTVLEGEIRFADHATDVERGCVSWALLRLRALGGKSGAGFGWVSLEAAEDAPSAAPYELWLETTPDLGDRLRSLAATLTQPAKKGKKGA